jgi:mannosyl-oligosaccharide alpha-1,2-mannosidase
MNRVLQRWILLILLSGFVLYYLTNLRGLESRIPSFLGGEPHHINWAKVPQKHPLTTYFELPLDPPRALPTVQAKFTKESDTQTKERLERRETVKKVFLRSWTAYKQNAWGHDEFAPVTGSWKDHFGGWGATLVDALDTLLIMGLNDEFKVAVEACKTIDFSVTHIKVLNIFETTIRYLGGLLSAHELAQGKDGGVLLQKAKELGEMLYHAFDTANRMPIARWKWEK